MELFYVLLVLLLASRLLGEVAEWVNQPSLIGEIIAGIGIGIAATQFPGAFPVLSEVKDDRVFTAITDLGIFFLMLMAGAELRPQEVGEASVKGFLIALGGLLVPLVGGFFLGQAVLPESDALFAQSLFLGTALAITAVPVSVRVLIDLGMLDSPIGRTIVSAAVIDDILSLVLLAVLTAIIETGEMPGSWGMLMLLGQVLVFFAITIAIGQLVFPRMAPMMQRARAAEVEVSMLLIVAFAFALLAEALGLHFIVGAFVAGLFFGREETMPHFYQDVRKRLAGITTGFLAPIFFASIGLHMTGAALLEVPVFVIALIALALFAKMLGAGLPALILGHDRTAATAIGVGMSGRGAVELIIADIALRAGLFQTPDPPPPIIANMFSAVVVMAVVTTLLTPIVLRRTLRSS